MSTAFQALERTRASLNDLISQAATDLDRERSQQQAEAATAIEQAATDAYRRGHAAGLTLGAVNMQSRVLTLLRAQLDSMMNGGVRAMHLDALILAIQDLE